MVLKAKEKAVQRLIAARFEDINVLIFALMGKILVYHPFS